MSVYTVSVEPSGDALNVGLLRELRLRDPGIALHAIGGARVEREGFESAIDVGPLSVVGFVEGIKILPAVKRLVVLAARDILRVVPDAVVLIDSWGFSIRLAQRLRNCGYQGQIVKYVAPQVWAMRQGRARVLARHVDRLLALYPFDAPFFEAEGLPTEVVGNPVLDVDWNGGDGPGFRERHSIAGADPLLLVAFGSRVGEIERLTAPFLATIAKLKARRPDLTVVTPVVPNTRAQLMARLATAGLDAHHIVPVADETRDALAASDIALLKSGTITTQAADARVPSVVAYAVNPLTYWPARMLMKADHISIVNVCAGAELMPEYIQHAIDPEAMAARLDGWLADPAKAQALGDAMRAVTERMRGEGGANARAAEAVLRVLE